MELPASLKYFRTYMRENYPKEGSSQETKRVEKWLQDNSEEALRYLNHAIDLCGFKYLDLFDGEGFTHLLEALRLARVEYPSEYRKHFFSYLEQAREKIPHMRSFGLMALVLTSFDSKRWDDFLPDFIGVVNQWVFAEPKIHKPSVDLKLIHDNGLIMRLFVEAYLTHPNPVALKWLPKLLGGNYGSVRYFYTEEQWKALMGILTTVSDDCDHEEALERLPYFVGVDTTSTSILALKEILTPLWRVDLQIFTFYGHTVLHPTMGEDDLTKFFSEMLDPDLSEDARHFIFYTLRQHREKWKKQDLTEYWKFYESVKKVSSETEEIRYDTLCDLVK